MEMSELYSYHLGVDIYLGVSKILLWQRIHRLPAISDRLEWYGWDLAIRLVLPRIFMEGVSFLFLRGILWWKMMAAAVAGCG